MYDMGEKNGDSSYVGVNEFVEETHQLQQSGEDLQDLKPKTYTTDEVYCFFSLAPAKETL